MKKCQATQLLAPSLASFITLLYSSCDGDEGVIADVMDSFSYTFTLLFAFSFFLCPSFLFAEKIIDILLSSTKSYGLGEELDR